MHVKPRTRPHTTVHRPTPVGIRSVRAFRRASHIIPYFIYSSAAQAAHWRPHRVSEQTTRQRPVRIVLCWWRRFWRSGHVRWLRPVRIELWAVKYADYRGCPNGIRRTRGGISTATPSLDERAHCKVFGMVWLVRVNCSPCVTHHSKVWRQCRWMTDHPDRRTVHVVADRGPPISRDGNC